MLSFFHIIILTPLFVSFFWGIYFLISSFGKNSNSNRHLFFFMFSAFMAFMAGVTFFLKNYYFYQKIYVPVVFFALAQFPTLYIYIKSLTNYDNFSKKVYLHYLYPLLAMLLAIVIHCFWMTREENYIFVSKYLVGDIVDNSKLKLAFFIDKFYKISFIFLGILYYFKINIRVKQYRKIIDDYFSDLDVVNLHWIYIFNVLFLLTVFSGIFFHGLTRSFFVKNPVFLVFPNITLSAFLWVVGYFGSSQKLILKKEKMIN